MEEEDVREVLRSYGVDLWSLIEASVSLAAKDHAAELRRRRDGIVAKLHAAAGGGGGSAPPCRRCDAGGEAPSSVKRSGSSSTPRSDQGGEEEEEEDDGCDEQIHLRNGHDLPIDAEQRQIFAIKDLIEDPDQPEGVLVKHLERLLDMEISFKALKETDVGRSVNVLRKHPSGEVRRLVKQLMRKWKEIVDMWVKSNSGDASPAALITADGDSPQTGSLLHSPSHQNGHDHHHQAVPDFGHSPSPHRGMAAEMDSRRKVTPRKEAPAPTVTTRRPAMEQQENSAIDAERLASARRRLHENYQEAQNAKKQRTIQVMDIHEIPKKKNAFFPRNNKGGGKHW